MDKSVTELEDKLDSFDPVQRRAALAELAHLVRSGTVTLPAPGERVNLHAHSFYSYNALGYSPSRIVWRGRSEGLWAVGLVDFDVLDGIDEFFQAGADVITFHVEAVEDPRPLLERIREMGAGAGLALSPKTELSRIDGCLGLCDLVLAMSVAPGFGKQEFNAVALEKFRRLRQLVGDDVMLEVDGGVNRTTIERCAEAGAGYFVVGSAIFGTEDYGPVVRELSQLAGRR